MCCISPDFFPPSSFSSSSSSFFFFFFLFQMKKITLLSPICSLKIKTHTSFQNLPCAARSPCSAHWIRRGGRVGGCTARNKEAAEAELGLGLDAAPLCEVRTIVPRPEVLLASNLYLLWGLSGAPSIGSEVRGLPLLEI